MARHSLKLIDVKDCLPVCCRECEMAFRQSILLINFWCLPNSLYYASASQLICFSCWSSKTLICYSDIPTLNIDRDYTSAFST